METIPRHDTAPALEDPAASSVLRRGHIGPWEYVSIALILVVATIAEVALKYATAVPGSLMVGLLIFLAVVKFTLVVLYYMHLRFDSRFFGRLFLMGLALALVVYVVVLLIFGVFR